MVLAIGMQVMVTFNVATDLDLANGARGRVVDIVLDSRESGNTRVKALPGLRAGVLPVTPMCSCR